jgi:hypothetical protein
MREVLPLIPLVLLLFPSARANRLTTGFQQMRASASAQIHATKECGVCFSARRHTLGVPPPSTYRPPPPAVGIGSSGSSGSTGE